MDQTIFKRLEDSTIAKVIQSLEAHRDETGTGYKNGGRGAGTLHIQLLDEQQQPFGRSVMHHANGHGYCERIIVFNTPAEGDKAASTVTRHYHHKHLLKMRVMNSTMKATPTDCDIENIGNDVVAFLKNGTLPTTLQLG